MPQTQGNETEEQEAARPGLAYGWLAKGLLFVVIGLLGLEIVRRGSSSENPDQRGALEAIAAAPVGRIAVLVVSVGLLFYAVWQVWAAWSQSHEGDDLDTSRAIHIAKRIGWVGLAAVYTLIAVNGLQIALGRSGSSDGSGGASGGSASPTAISGRLLELPAGELLVAALGLGTIAVGGYQLVKGLRSDFLDDIVTDDLDDDRTRLLSWLGTAGFVARAMLMGIAGWLFIEAARTHDPDRAGGIDQSLGTLATAPGGQILLATCSLGLIAAGAYDMATFRRQRIDEVV